MAMRSKTKTQTHRRNLTCTPPKSLAMQSKTKPMILTPKPSTFGNAVENEILDTKGVATWDDIAGLEFAKKCVMEIVVWPMLRPDIFTGLRGPPKVITVFRFGRSVACGLYCLVTSSTHHAKARAKPSPFPFSNRQFAHHQQQQRISP
jgi:hypothetical protein